MKKEQKKPLTNSLPWTILYTVGEGKVSKACGKRVKKTLTAEIKSTILIKEPGPETPHNKKDEIMNTETYTETYTTEDIKNALVNFFGEGPLHMVCEEAPKGVVEVTVDELVEEVEIWAGEREVGLGDIEKHIQTHYTEAPAQESSEIFTTKAFKKAIKNYEHFFVNFVVDLSEAPENTKIFSGHFRHNLFGNFCGDSLYKQAKKVVKNCPYKIFVVVYGSNDSTLYTCMEFDRILVASN